MYATNSRKSLYLRLDLDWANNSNQDQAKGIIQIRSETGSELLKTTSHLVNLK